MNVRYPFSIKHNEVYLAKRASKLAKSKLKKQKDALLTEKDYQNYKTILLTKRLHPKASPATLSKLLKENVFSTSLCTQVPKQYVLDPDSMELMKSKCKVEIVKTFTSTSVNSKCGFLFVGWW